MGMVEWEMSRFTDRNLGLQSNLLLLGRHLQELEDDTLVVGRNLTLFLIYTRAHHMNHIHLRTSLISRTEDMNVV